jgi:2-methylisocitrate lyase-like PEP mutase family enzyme
MITRDQRRRAEEFLALHHAPELLILPNAWDVVSARLYELEGFKAVATTSAGISSTLGYPDGQRIDLQEMIEAIRLIAEHVSVPVSADLEAGYATAPEGVAGSVEAALNVGVVGINLEDGTGNSTDPLFDQTLQAEKIHAAREMASSAGIHLVINARTDVYLVANGTPAEQVRHAIRRGNAYRLAGADCVFVPDMGTLDEETIARLVKEIDAPINVVAGDRMPSLPELEEIGVARVTFGPRPMRATLALIRKMAREWIEIGTYSTMTADTLSYAEVNAMFEGRRVGEADGPPSAVE